MPGTMGAEDASINRLTCPQGSQSLLERKVELVCGGEGRSTQVWLQWSEGIAGKYILDSTMTTKAALRRSSLTWHLDGDPDC